MDLADLYTGRLSCRKLLVLIRGLRAGSRIHKDWSQSEHLMAIQVDLLSKLVWLNYATVQLAGGKEIRDYLSEPPELLPRPQDEQRPKQKPVMTPIRVAQQMLGG